MNWVRRSLRATAIAWLILQAATLAVFIPQACCLAHNAAAAARSSQPECPMHPSTPPAEQCRMTAACGGQSATLPVSIAVAGVALPVFRFDPAITSVPIDIAISHVVGAGPRSTSPPPKA